MTEPASETPADVAVRVAATALYEQLRNTVGTAHRPVEAFHGTVEAVAVLADALIDRRVTLLQALAKAAQQQPTPETSWVHVAAAVRRGLTHTPDGDVDTFVRNILAELREVLP